MKLELNTETIRDLSDEDLEGVAAGSEITAGPLTQSPACPSGSTWFASCETLHICP
ncbi:MAG TPA: hypothetical protein VJ927_10510 [Actinomycetota bacterium]|nr:hypothetical protein [Actinomycetota bacterium]